MKEPGLSKEFFIKNRLKLKNLLKKNSLVILHSNDEMPRNGDQYFPFRQNSNMIYLTGLVQEKTIFCYFPDFPDVNLREIAFIIQPDMKMETWEGHKYSIEEAKSVSGISNIQYISDFNTVIRDLILYAEQVYIYQNEYPKFYSDVPERNHRRLTELLNNYTGLSIDRLAPLIDKLRLIKEPEEIDIIKQACEISNSAFHRVLKTTKPGCFEYQIEAEIIYEFRKSGARGHAYAPIVATGKNACTLHYVSNNCQCHDGDLVLLDFGAEVHNYAADCSRTIPVNGKYSQRQKDCYQAVLRVFKKARELFVPGNTIAGVNKKVNKFLEEEMIRLGLFSAKDVENQDKKSPMYFKYFMHGTSHFVGLDVHDSGDKFQAFEKGMVLTCEPGLYIEDEGIGIRIENDILVDDKPIDLMIDIPIEVEEIESIMKQ